MAIQGQLLEVTVFDCINLKNTGWFLGQDPYVCLEYANNKFRTSTCTDGDTNPLFIENFTFPLIEGLREINVVVMNSNTFSRDDFIGSGKVYLHKALSEGFDKRGWAIQSRSGKYAGEVRLVLRYSCAQKQEKRQRPGTPPCHTVPPSPQFPAPPYPIYMPPAPYPPPAYASYPPVYPPPPAYPPLPVAEYYTPPTYPPQAYTPQMYQPVQPYPHPPPPGYPGIYPPPPY